MKKIIPVFLLFSALLSACSSSKNTAATAEEINRAIDDHHWIFIAQRATGDVGSSRQLTSSYDVVLKGDTMISVLPYMGRAYSGVGYETKSVLDFKSYDFSIEELTNKKGAKIITVKPNDYLDVQSYTFTFFDNGNADLKVILNNRSPMTFTGTVRPNK